MAQPPTPARSLTGLPVDSANLPNALTVVRIMLVPVLVLALAVDGDGGDALAAATLVVAGSTDWLDGHLARSRESVTTFGKVMDPIADKLLVLAALVSLVGLERVAAWVAVVVLARELAVSGLRIAAGQRGRVISASPLGKAKTVVQLGAILALILAPDASAAWVQIVVYAMVGVTVVSGLDYFLSYRRAVERGERGPQASVSAAASASAVESRSSSSSREAPRR